jgi:hypothetical protein
MLDDGRGSSQEHGAVAHQGKHRACYLPAHLRTHPNGSTQMHALRDLVRDAYPGDAFVFFCGHPSSSSSSVPFRLSVPY